MKKLKLHGFNNLTKSLSISLYQANYIEDDSCIKTYNAEIYTQYNAVSLGELLNGYVDKIGATILNSSVQDYSPQGASVNIMIAEAEEPPTAQRIFNHLDKSHICAHTYPEEFCYQGMAYFRLDLEISTCGVISPLVLLEDIFKSFSPDLIFIDYRVRGVNIDKDRNKQFLDHAMNSIQNYLPSALSNLYQVEDYNSLKQHIFHSRFIIKQLEENKVLSYLKRRYTRQTQLKIIQDIYNDLLDIYKQQ